MKYIFKAWRATAAVLLVLFLVAGNCFLCPSESLPVYSDYNMCLGATGTPDYLANISDNVIQTYGTLPLLKGNAEFYRRVNSKYHQSTYAGVIRGSAPAAQTSQLNKPNPAPGSIDMPITTTVSWSPAAGFYSYYNIKFFRQFNG